MGVGTVFDSLPFAGLWGPVFKFVSGVVFSPFLSLAAARRAVLSWTGHSFSTRTTKSLRLYGEPTTVLEFDVAVTMTDLSAGPDVLPIRRALPHGVLIRFSDYHAQQILSGKRHASPASAKPS